MARTTYVKRAQQRFAMVPDIDPATGQQKVTPVMAKCWDCNGTGKDGRKACPSCNGEGERQKVAKTGPVVRRLTIEDRTKPLDMPSCDKCGVTIKVGRPYKWIAPKSGPYGGSKRFRCGSCPDWQVWEYSSSTDARIAQILNDAEIPSDLETVEDAQQVLSDVAEALRELAGEKRESAESIESGFQHETVVSQELSELADNLESWADEIEGTDIEDLPEPEESDCPDCNGEGKITKDDEEGVEPSEVDCEKCEGSGLYTPEEPTDEQMDEWRATVQGAIEDALGSQPF
jgi:RecJ-like exonuclease